MNSTLSTIKRNNQTTSSDAPAKPEQVDHANAIANLVEQLQRENQRIAELVQHQRELRLQILRAQEEQLSALRPASNNC